MFYNKYFNNIRFILKFLACRVNVRSVNLVLHLHMCDLFSLQDDVPALLNSRPQTGLSFLAPEPEDLEDLYSRYKVCMFVRCYFF